MTSSIPDQERLPRFGEEDGECPRCGAPRIYRYGNFWCTAECGWTTQEDDSIDSCNRTTLERCPECGARIVYNGNYFCQAFGRGCDWALPHPARRRRDKDIAVALTGQHR
jgi:DNA-directed RNA polymerase subunit RPC12/RpoP